MKITVYSVERCYDYEGCSLERVYGTLAEAEAYVKENSYEGMCSTFSVVDWAVEATPEPSKAEEP